MRCMSCGQPMGVYRGGWWLCQGCGLCTQMGAESWADLPGRPDAAERVPRPARTPGDCETCVVTPEIVEGVGR